MKTIIETTDGLEALLGDRVFIQCVNYFYCGILAGVNDTCVKLTDASIVYSTGPLDEMSNRFKYSERWPSDSLYLQTAAIEAYSRLGMVQV